MTVWESLRLPLLYGVAASIGNVTPPPPPLSDSSLRYLALRFLSFLLSSSSGVGLFSLVFGLVCAHCCCRNTAHTPRSRNKLMDLEMD